MESIPALEDIFEYETIGFTFKIPPSLSND
jgi:hypothetical protein